MPSIDILPQLIINGLISGAIYALAACGFALVYYVVRFQYFSHGAIIGLSAYAFFLFSNIMKMGLVNAILLTVIASIILVMLSNWLVYSPMRKRKSTPAIMLVSSIVLLIMSASLILALFGSSTKTLELASKNRTFDFGIVTITLVQVLIISFALALFILLFFILKKTRLGRAMRAISDNKDVARIVGVSPEKIYDYTFIISAVMGAASGILIGLEQNLYPRMGVLIIIKGFIGAVVGGLGSVPGSIIGGFFIGLAENVGAWVLPTGYKDIISFTVLLLFLLFRPQGLLGVRMRDDS